MLKLPEVITIAKQFNEVLSMKQIKHVYPQQNLINFVGL